MEKRFNRNLNNASRTTSREKIDKRRVTSYNSEKVMVAKVRAAAAEQVNLQAPQQLPNDVVLEKDEREETTQRSKAESKD